MMTAKTAATWKNEPAERSLQAVADADPAEIDRSAMGTLAGEYHLASLAWRGSRLARIIWQIRGPPSVPEFISYPGDRTRSQK